MEVKTSVGEIIDIGSGDAEDMALSLISHLPISYVLEAGSTRYDMVIVPMAEQYGVHKVMPEGRFLVAVTNFGVAWHFGMIGEQGWQYVADKLGMNEADAGNVAGFLEILSQSLAKVRAKRDAANAVAKAEYAAQCAARMAK